jgi:hypothetical protein
VVQRTYRTARRKGVKKIANACLCYQLGFLGYLGSIIFLAQAYHFYLPTMIGLAIALSTVAMREMSAAPKLAAAPAVRKGFAVG